MGELPVTLERLDCLLMSAGGLVLLAAAVRWWRAGRGDPLRGSPLRVSRLSPLALWVCLVLYGLAAGVGTELALWALPAGLGGQAKSAWQAVLATNMMQVLMVGILLAAARILFVSGWRGLGIGRRTLGAEIGWMVGGLLAAICVCGVVLLITKWVVEWLRYVPPGHSVFQTLEDPDSPRWMRVVSVGGAIVLAPVGEELLFRGFLQTGIRKLVWPRWGSMRHRWMGIGVAAVLFGAMHLQMRHHVPALIVLGIVLGYLYERSGSLTVPIGVHMLFNAKTLLWYHLARM